MPRTHAFQSPEKSEEDSESIGKITQSFHCGQHHGSEIEYAANEAMKSRREKKPIFSILHQYPQQFRDDVFQKRYLILDSTVGGMKMHLKRLYPEKE